MSLRADLARLAWEERRTVLASLPLPLRRYLHDGWFGQGGLHQVAPDEAGPWHTWLVLGGRGAGKTRAGAEWVNGMAGGLLGIAERRAMRIALVGETLADVRDVMVHGPSGLVATAP